MNKTELLARGSGLHETGGRLFARKYIAWRCLGLLYVVAYVYFLICFPLEDSKAGM